MVKLRVVLVFADYPKHPTLSRKAIHEVDRCDTSQHGIKNDTSSSKHHALRISILDSVIDYKADSRPNRRAYFLRWHPGPAWCCACIFMFSL